MAKPYSEEFLLTVMEADQRQVGVQLARLCIDGNIPIIYIAKALGTSRMTVYNWFRGQDIRHKTRTNVESLISILKTDMENGVLPVKTRFDAKDYMERATGVKMEDAIKSS